MGKTLTIYVLLLEAVFVLSRACFYGYGISFDTTPLYFFLQYIDPQLLRTRLLESLFYLHSQPPLFNLFLGFLLKCFPAHFVSAANIIYLAFGQLFMAGLFLLMVRLGALPVLAFIATAVFMVSPGVVMYENLLFYEYPAAMLMVWAGIWLHIYAQQRRTLHGLLFFLTLVLLGLLKAIFHLFWVLFIVVVVWRALKVPGKKLLIMAGIPCVLLAGVYTKNLWLFGDFTLGYVVFSENILNMAVNVLPKRKVYEYYKEGNISPLTAVTVLNKGQYLGWEERERIVASELSKVEKTGIPILDLHYNPTSMRPSIHSMLAYSNYRQHGKDSLFMIKKDFTSFRLSIERNCLLYFFPGPTETTLINRGPLGKYEDNFNFMFKHLNRLNGNELYTRYLLQWDKFYKLKWDSAAIAWLSLTAAFYVWLFLLGARRAWVLIRSLRRIDQDSLTLAFIVLNVLYVSSASILLSWWGANRYRFNIEAFYWVIFTLLLTQACQNLRSAYRNRMKAKPSGSV